MVAFWLPKTGKLERLQFLTTLLDALDEMLEPLPCIIVLAPKYELKEWMPVVQSTYAPGPMSFAIPDDTENLPEALNVRASRDGDVAYLCEGTQCSAPITTKAEFARAIKKLK